MRVSLNKYKSVLLSFKHRHSLLSQHPDRCAAPNGLSISFLYSFPFRLLGSSRYLALHFVCNLCWEMSEESQEGCCRYHFYTGHSRCLHAEACFPDTAITNTQHSQQRQICSSVPPVMLSSQSRDQAPRQQNSLPGSRPTLQLPLPSCLGGCQETQ